MSSVFRGLRRVLFLGYLWVVIWIVEWPEHLLATGFGCMGVFDWWLDRFGFLCECLC